MSTRGRRSPWTWAWLAWLGLFLFVELPAGVNRTPFDTLSEHVWFWFPGWWSVGPIGLMLALAAHFSPKHFSVRPVLAFGGLMVVRILSVEHLSPTVAGTVGVGLGLAMFAAVESRGGSGAVPWWSTDSEHTARVRLHAAQLWRAIRTGQWADVRRLYRQVATQETPGLMFWRWPSYLLACSAIRRGDSEHSWRWRLADRLNP